MPSPETIHERLARAFPGAMVEVTDLTGTQDHFQVVVCAREFQGQSRIAAHKMVYEALGPLMDGPIHALALKTRPITDSEEPASG